MENRPMEDNKLYFYIWGMVFTMTTTLILALTMASYNSDRVIIMEKEIEGRTITDMAKKGYSPVTTTECRGGVCTTTVVWNHIQFKDSP